MAGTGHKLWAAGDVVAASGSTSLNTYIQDQVVGVYADSTARDAAFGAAGEPTVAEGMFCYLTGSNEFQVYDGSAWVTISDPDVMVVDSANARVGVGTTSPTNNLSINVPLSATQGLSLDYSGEAKAGLLLHPNSGEVRIGAINSTGDYFVTVYADNAERLRVLAAGGLTFNGDTAAANALDDYEEGTWTPGIKFGTTAATVTVTHATYTKVGRMVHCMITALRPTDFNGGTGNISLTGLPFTSAANYYYGTVQGTPMSMATGESFIQVYVEGGTTARFLVQSTTAHADITDGDCATTTKFYGSFTYFV